MKQFMKLYYLFDLKGCSMKTKVQTGLSRAPEKFLMAFGPLSTNGPGLKYTWDVFPVQMS